MHHIVRYTTERGLSLWQRSRNDDRIFDTNGLLVELVERAIVLQKYWTMQNVSQFSEGFALCGCTYFRIWLSLATMSLQNKKSVNPTILLNIVLNMSKVQFYNKELWVEILPLLLKRIEATHSLRYLTEWINAVRYSDYGRKSLTDDYRNIKRISLLPNQSPIKILRAVIARLLIIPSTMKSKSVTDLKLFHQYQEVVSLLISTIYRFNYVKELPVYKKLSKLSTVNHVTLTKYLQTRKAKIALEKEQSINSTPNVNCT